MKKSELYKRTLMQTDNWEPYLMEHSNIPGPRANLELLWAVADMGDEERFLKYMSLDGPEVSGESKELFIVLCGVVGLGKLLTQGKAKYFQTLRRLAQDQRWRIREGVAMALQIYGKADMGVLLDNMDEWSKGNSFEKRAAVAALCEPVLLKKKEEVLRVLNILDNITGSILQIPLNERKEESFRVLNKGLAYCWSVAVAACPNEGKEIMERWFNCKDKNILWIMREKKEQAQQDGSGMG